MSDHVPTTCGPLDSLLGGGFERGTITQLYGPPASGKTNVSLSATVAVAERGGQAVYIDTEGFSLDRFHQLAEPRGDEDLTDHIHISAAHDFEEQHDAVADASDLAPSADLIVLDSATGFYRLERTVDGEDGGEALREVGRQLTSLLGLARRHDLAVIVTNQVYTDPDSDRIRPLGGHTLDHWTGVVIRLDRYRGGNRRATIEKHRSKPAGQSARFRITETGLAGDSQTTAEQDARR